MNEQERESTRPFGRKRFIGFEEKVNIFSFSRRNRETRWNAVRKFKESRNPRFSSEISVHNRVHVPPSFPEA